MPNKVHIAGGFGGTPTADSRFAVPCPSDRNALRNPPRQHVPTVTNKLKKEQTTQIKHTLMKNINSTKQ